MRHLLRIFDDWVTRAAGIVFFLIVALVMFNTYSDIAEEHVLLNMILLGLVPALFVAGGVIFVLAILTLWNKTQEEPEVSHVPKLMFLLFGGTVGVLLLILGGYQLIEFSDSTAFCGTLCHKPMQPEYVAHQASPHSRVLCSECHVGPGASYFVQSKLTGLPLVYAVTFNDYDRPIQTPVENLRPARETCERCHRPERFAGDLVRERTTFATDEFNTPTIDRRVLRVGGGESETAKDIHWHIAARVWYFAPDDKRHDIAWVGVQRGNSLEQFVDPEKLGELTTERVVKGERLMDCIDCHNRATHVFRSPAELIDAALTQGAIDRSLPFIRRESIRSLDPPNGSLDEALAKVEAIKQFYRNSYPEIYREKGSTIDTAVAELERIAELTTFPEMKVTWETYDNHLGHQKADVGCFRCHGKLVATSGERKGMTISASCDLCHYLLPPD